MQTTTKRCLLFVIAFSLFSSTCFAYYRTDEDKEKRVKLLLSSSHMYAARKLLIDHGVNTESEVQLTSALNNVNPLIRKKAMDLLVDRMGKKAVPLLQKVLNDPFVLNRVRASRFLGLYGIDEWQAQMKHVILDYNQYAASLENAQTDDEAKRIKKLVWVKQREAIAAAKVLSEFGDQSGYELAVQTALESDRPALRSEAIAVLGIIASNVKYVSSQESTGPIPVLIMIAQTENDPRVLKTGILKACDYLQKNSLVEILDALLLNPHLPEDVREGTALFLEANKTEPVSTIE